MSYADITRAEITPKLIAKELGISPKTLRAWLRRRYRDRHVKHERWYFTRYEANRIIELYRGV